jgi:PIN domain nuclease of toxin-antitoxin system
VHVPVVCFFELALLLERGRVRARLSFDEWTAGIAAHPGLPIEPLLLEDVREARGLVPLLDPFDRSIAAAAVRLDASLITSDVRIRESGLLRTLW